MAVDAQDYPVHPLRSQAKVLLLSVFGPYAQDDQYGSRLLNPMELCHNQVTRVQHAFSFRFFHRSWGLMLIQVNLKAPCTLLDFPSEERFVEEIKTRQYDVIGISSIIPNLFKVRRMCRLIRKHQPEATIVVGGHIANAPDLKKWVDADHIVKGEGVRWMRRFLGEDENQPIRHPRIISDISSRIMGVPLRHHPGIDDATLIPSVGCPMGCNFCSTSAMFGGKGKCIEFYRTGEEIFDIMCELESDLHVKSFFVMDENFLLNQKRTLGLLDLMETHGKPWSLKVFSSVNVLRRTRWNNWSPWESTGCGLASRARIPSTASWREWIRSRWSTRCNRTGSTCSVRALSASRNIRRKTSTKSSIMLSDTTRISISSCSTRPSPARPCTPNRRQKVRSLELPSSIWPIFTDS